MEPGVLDGELFDAGDEHPVDPLLPLEIIDRVLVEPPRERQKKAALDEEHQRAGDAPVAGEPHVRLNPPVGFGAEKLRQQRVLVGPIGRPAEKAIHEAEDLGVLVLRGAAAREHAAPQVVAHAILDLAHERLDTNDLVSQTLLL